MLNAKVLLTMHRENEGMKDGWRDLENDKERKERDLDFDVADPCCFVHTYSFYEW